MSFKERFNDTVEKINEVTDFSRKHDMVKLTRKEWDFSSWFISMIYTYVQHCAEATWQPDLALQPVLDFPVSRLKVSNEIFCKEIYADLTEGYSEGQMLGIRKQKRNGYQKNFSVTLLLNVSFPFLSFQWCSILNILFVTNSKNKTKWV